MGPETIKKIPDNDAILLNAATLAARDELRLAARGTGGLRWVCAACGVVFQSTRRRAPDARCATCVTEAADRAPVQQRRANRAWWRDRYQPWFTDEGITTPCAGQIAGCQERVRLGGCKKWCSDRCRKRTERQAVRLAGSGPS